MSASADLPVTSNSAIQSGARFHPMPRLPWLLSPGLGLWRVRQLGRFWEDSGTSDAKRTLWDATCRFVQGMYAPFGFLLARFKGELFVGWVSGEASGVKGLLEGCYPGIVLDNYRSGVPNLLAKMPPFSTALFISGNPSIPILNDSEVRLPEPAGLDQLVQGLASYDWFYVLWALPLDEIAKQEELLRLLNFEKEMRARYLRPGTALEKNNPQAEAVMQRVLSAKAKVEEGLKTGLWGVMPILYLVQKEGTSEGVSLLKSIFAGKDAEPQPLEIQICFSTVTGSPGESRFPHSILNARELARYAYMPQQEYQGYATRTPAIFDTHQTTLKEDQSLLLGNLANSPHSTVSIGIKHLPTHMLIAGTTGSGKTNTCLSLLYQAWKIHHIPFLVLETSEKAEYGRKLKELMENDLQIFTVGDESNNPLHLDLLRVPLQTHIEAHLGHLTKIFKASFPLPPPTPYLLEEALQLWYVRSGWNLEKNEKADTGLPLHFSELIEIVRELLQTKYSHYDAETRGNIESALLSRLDSLTRGGIGRLLTGRADDEKNWETLLKKPMVMELKTITDPDKKALAVLFILYRLISSAHSDFRLSGGRRHITVIEEAHRVLKQRETTPNNPDIADTQAAVVEEFAHALAEVRHAGEGLIILDQMPSRLSPAVRSNTNMKIAHRLPDEEEQRIFAQAAGLTDQQRQLLYRLQPGEALWFPADGGVFHVKVPVFKEHRY
ncbi:MAG: ATP-binding protein [Pseudomonadota bacterium]